MLTLIPPRVSRRLSFRLLRLKLRLDFLCARECALQFCGKRLDKFRRVARYSHRRRKIAQCVFRNDLTARLAENYADGQLVIFMAKLIVHGRKVEVHLAKVLRLETCRLEIDDDIAAE